METSYEFTDISNITDHFFSPCEIIIENEEGEQEERPMLLKKAKPASSTMCEK